MCEVVIMANKPKETGYGSDEQKWQAEDDVRTLTQAQAIMADKQRHNRALKCAREKLAEMQQVVAKGGK